MEEKNNSPKDPFLENKNVGQEEVNFTVSTLLKVKYACLSFIDDLKGG